MPHHYQLYRYTHPNGAAKDWAIGADGAGRVTVWWGPSAPRLIQHKRFPSRSPDWIEQRTRAKCRKGYVRVGTVQIDDDGTVQPCTPASPPPRTPTTVLYWTLTMTEADDPAARAAVSALVDRVLLIGTNAESDTVWDGASRIRAWLTGDPGRTLSGQLRPAQGIGPLLCLWALREATLPTLQVGLVDDTTRALGLLKDETALLEDFGADLETLRPLAEALDLLPARIDWAVLTGEDFYF